MFSSDNGSGSAADRKQYLLAVYIIPATIITVLCLLTYFFRDKLQDNDKYYCYFLATAAAFTVMVYNKSRWLKLPDGAYINTKDISSVETLNPDEPEVYEEEYFYSKKEKTMQIFWGLVSLGAAIFLFTRVKAVFISLTSALTGSFFIYSGIKGITNKTSQLKLAKTGIWTAKLGFTDWNRVSKIVVTTDEKSHAPACLEIHLKDTPYAAAGRADEVINIAQLTDKEYIEMTANTLMGKRNESR